MGDGEPEWMVKKREYEQRMARVKNAKLRTLCSICSAKAKLPCPCGTAQYCTVACQKVDWRERGHKKVCKEIRARAEAPTPPTPPPSLPVYGPAPRSGADEVRAQHALLVFVCETCIVWVHVVCEVGRSHDAIREH